MRHTAALAAVGAAVFACRSPFADCAAGGSGLAVIVSDADRHFDFNVTLDGAIFLEGEAAFMTAGGVTYSTGDGSLVPAGAAAKDHGHDALGDFDRFTFDLLAPAHSDGAVLMRASVRTYEDGSTLVFEQQFPSGITDGPAVSVDGNGVGSGFPVFAVDPTRPRGVLSYTGRFVEASRAGSWSGASGPQMGLGLSGGPFVLFDDPRGAGDAVAVSHVSNFMASSFDKLERTLPSPSSSSSSSLPASPSAPPRRLHGAQPSRSPSPRNGAVSAPPVTTSVASGLLGSLTTVPANFTVSTALVLGRRGVSSAVKALGDRLLRVSGKDTAAARRADISLHSLGYDTANGAYYYYHPNGTYADTLVDVVNHARATGLPLQWLALDSWWYPKGSGGGVLVWEPPLGGNAFPQGLAAFRERVGGLRFMMHNRHWSANNEYALQNGGAYPFSADAQTGLAVPLSQQFWDDLLGNKSKVGLAVYLQDWMYNELQGNNLTLQNATMGTTWLRQMSNAAAERGMGIQYCMTFPRMLLTAVELGALSQWRASDDYGPGQTESCSFPYCVYYIGTTSLLSWALGLAPAKDNFWSSEWQPGSAYRNTTHEPYSEMQVAVAAFSTGPVTPSDGVGFTNVSLVLMSCSRGGTLLQPSRPMSAIDACYGGDAFGFAAGQPKPNRAHVYPVMSSHTAVNVTLSSSPAAPALRQWADVLAIGLAGAGYNITAADLPLDLDATSAAFVAWTGYSAEVGRANVTVLRARGVQPTATSGGAAVPNDDDDDAAALLLRRGARNDATLVPLVPCNYSDFALWHLAPVVGTSGAVFLGEPAKFVPVSVQRLVSVDASSDSDLRVTVWGDAGEQAEFAFADSATGAVSYVTCVFPAQQQSQPQTGAGAGDVGVGAGSTMVLSSATKSCR